MADEEVVGLGEQKEVVVPNPSEEKARTQGWVPKEEFRGDPEKWVDAQTFVERGEKIIPILKERNDHLFKEVKEVKDSVKEIKEFYAKSEERAYQKALRELEQRKLEAVENADVESYRAAESERAELEKSKPVVTAQPQEPPEMAAFRGNNSWYGTDPEMTTEADALGAAYINQGIPYGQMLERVANRIKKLYPEKFTNPRRENSPTVETVNAETGLPKKAAAKSFENLPEDAKKQCNKWVTQGLLTKEDYVRDYAWD
jgi:hypothetical protein